MGTRCNIKIIIQDEKEATEEWFYRHYDGYPDEVMANLMFYSDILFYRQPYHIFSNKSLQAGSIINELNSIMYSKQKPSERVGINFDCYRMLDNIYKPRVTTYEKTTGVHGDIAYLYQWTFQFSERRLTGIGIHCEERIVDWDNDTEKLILHQGIHSNHSIASPEEMMDYFNNNIIPDCWGIRRTY